MDALPMMELNDSLPYASKNHGVAHTCGHDGHTACLLGVVPLLLARKQEIPSNKTVRLIFQPSEEMINGARFMIDNGCLEGVDEVYGMHNAIMGQFGHLYCKEGVVLSDSTTIKIVIVGDGGHGSLSGGLKISIWKAVEFYSNIKSYIDELKIQGRFFECVLPVFQAGEAANVISEKAVIEGTLRTFES
jgi:hippurate hydrolase